MSNNKAIAATGALSGLRVLDLSRVLAGPWASQILGDLGAEIIKIEHPGHGDDTRNWGPPFLCEPGSSEKDRLSAYYLCCNRNKRSVAIDIATEEGADIVRDLARNSDIVIENFKLGNLARYGLDYASLSALNPRLIYCSITGFGQTGPLAARPGYDFLIQGMSGLMSITGQPDGTPGSEPLKVGVAVSDIFTGLYATIATLAAVRHREQTGRGQYLDCALLDSQIAVLANQASNWLVGGLVPSMMGNHHPNVVPYRTFATADGHIIVAVGNDRQFKALCTLLGRDDLPTDPRFADNANRLANREALEDILERAIHGWSSDKMIAAMAVVGVPGGPINRIDQVLQSPQVMARGLVQEMVTERGTTVRTVGFPVKMSDSPPTCHTPPPRLGQHTETVLCEILGFDAEHVAHLRDLGVLGRNDLAPNTPQAQPEHATAP